VKTHSLIPAFLKGKPTSCPAIGTFLISGRITMMPTCGGRKEGRKEDVLNLPGQDRGGYWPSGEPIVLSLDEPVEFKVLPLEG
jgi:hypothetical protein